ncbi:MAG: MCP four helix bundle domain-containing protein, partial [Planctomycetaceae bacterium]
MRLTIGKKLGFGFGLIIVLIATCATVAFVQLSTMDQRLNEAFEHALPATRASESALTGIARVRGTMRGYLLLTVLGNNV